MWSCLVRNRLCTLYWSSCIKIAEFWHFAYQNIGWGGGIYRKLFGAAILYNIDRNIWICDIKFHRNFCTCIIKVPMFSHEKCHLLFCLIENNFKKFKVKKYSLAKIFVEKVYYMSSLLFSGLRAITQRHIRGTNGRNHSWITKGKLDVSKRKRCFLYIPPVEVSARNYGETRILWM